MGRCRVGECRRGRRVERIGWTPCRLYAPRELSLTLLAGAQHPTRLTSQVDLFVRDVRIRTMESHPTDPRVLNLKG